MESDKYCIITVASSKFLSRYKVLYDSLISSGSSVTIKILYIRDEYSEWDSVRVQKKFPKAIVHDVTSEFEKRTQYSDKVQRICSLRAWWILKYGFGGGYEHVVFTGADLEFFGNSLKTLLREVSQHNAVVVPHLNVPYPLAGGDSGQGAATEQGYFETSTFAPSHRQIAWAGYFNTDLCAYKNNWHTRSFLVWMSAVCTDDCVSDKQVFYDQTWFNFITSFVSDVKVMRNFMYAYWNIYEGTIQGMKPRVDTNVKLKDKVFQYSGFARNKIHKLSIYQNRWKARENMKRFLESYADRIEAEL